MPDSSKLQMAHQSSKNSQKTRNEKSAQKRGKS